MALGWMYSPSQIGHYLLTRISSLAPPRTEKMKNPISVLRQLDGHQWLMFWVGFIGWTCKSKTENHMSNLSQPLPILLLSTQSDQRPRGQF